jgi:hypothetical protein
MAGTISRKKYNEFVKQVEIAFDADTAQKIAVIFNEAANYDPSAPYPKSKATPTPRAPNPEYGQRYIERRKAQAIETGVSTYILSGRKKHYEKERALRIERLQKERDAENET